MNRLFAILLFLAVSAAAAAQGILPNEYLSRPDFVRYLSQMIEEDSDYPKPVNDYITIASIRFDTARLEVVTNYTYSVDKIRFELMRNSGYMREAAVYTYASEPDTLFLAMGFHGIGVRMIGTRLGTTDTVLGVLTSQEILDAQTRLFSSASVAEPSIASPDDEIRQDIELSRKMLPIQIDKSLSVVDLRYADRTLTYVYQIDSPGYDIDYARRQAVSNRQQQVRNILNGLGSSSNHLLDILKEVQGQICIVYRHLQSHDSIQICISSQELLSHQQEAGQSSLHQMAQEADASCPQEMNGITLTSVKYHEGENIFRYTYQLDELTLINLQERITYIRQAMYEQMAQSDDMRSLILMLAKDRSSLEYLYTSKTSPRKIAITFTPEEVGELVRL